MMLSMGLTVKIKQRNVFVAGEVVFFFNFTVCFILCGCRNKYWHVYTVWERISGEDNTEGKKRVAGGMFLSRQKKMSSNAQMTLERDM